MCGDRPGENGMYGIRVSYVSTVDSSIPPHTKWSQNNLVRSANSTISQFCGDMDNVDAYSLRESVSMDVDSTKNGDKEDGV